MSQVQGEWGSSAHAKQKRSPQSHSGSHCASPSTRTARPQQGTLGHQRTIALSCARSGGTLSHSSHHSQGALRSPYATVVAMARWCSGPFSLSYPVACSRGQTVCVVRPQASFHCLRCVLFVNTPSTLCCAYKTSWLSAYLYVGLYQAALVLFQERLVVAYERLHLSTACTREDSFKNPTSICSMPPR